MVMGGEDEEDEEEGEGMESLFCRCAIASIHPLLTVLRKSPRLGSDSRLDRLKKGIGLHAGWEEGH